MNDYPITDEQAAFFRENGYIQLHGVLTPDELQDIRLGVDEVLAERRKNSADHSVDPQYARVFLQMVNLWRVNERVCRHTLSPKLARIAQTLLGAGSIRLWHDHALIKMPGDSKPSAWHQDLPYWPHQQQDSLSCWMALDDVSEENGCMWFVPKSHTWGRLEPIRLGDPQDLFGLVADPDGKDFTAIPMPMKAGSCTFHHSLEFHYAGANTTGAPRRAMVSIYMADGTTYSGQGHICTGGLGLKLGDKLDGELFPVVG